VEQGPSVGRRDVYPRGPRDESDQDDAPRAAELPGESTEWRDADADVDLGATAVGDAEINAIVASGMERDRQADRRDEAAEHREMAGNMRDFGKKNHDQDAYQDRTAAHEDHRRARVDRESAAADRANLVASLETEARRRHEAEDRAAAAERRMDAANNHAEAADGRGSDDRSLSAHDRDQTAEDRDQISEALDQVADTRDERAESRDRRAERRDQAAARFDPGASSDRDGAWRDRQGGAGDRKHAAEDRAAASKDRVVSARERTASSIDELTRAHRRDAGMVELAREAARAKRTHEPFVLAFVDVDGLKATNDSRGHVAGDQLLRRVVDTIAAHLRSYDLIVRFGGDEFLCGLLDFDTARAAERFAWISADLAADPHASISLGLAELRAQDTLDDLIARADAALRTGRQQRASARS
jgi:diguanylate cyclase (GGDEF)-like protein